MDGIAAGVASIASWAAQHPQIRRVWMLLAAKEGRVDVALELAPVGDSEETFGVWMARADKWRSQLESRLPFAVDLEWIDPDGASRAARVRTGEARTLVYERSA